jgi:hypothetical protein
MAGIICPHCACSDVRRVKRQGLLERRILSTLSIFPFQCGRCGRRFLVPLPPDAQSCESPAVEEVCSTATN